MNNSKTVRDDWFHNIDILSDPALGHLSEISRNDYIANTSALYQLRASSAGDKSIDFKSDRWDFTPFLSRGEKASNPVLVFKDLPEDVKTYLKYFLNYYRNKQPVKISTIYIRYTNLKAIIKDTLKNHPETGFEDITTGMLIDSIDNRNLANETKRYYYTSLFYFYDYLIRICNIPLLIDLQQLEEFVDKAIKAAKKEDTRLPNIPKEVAKKIEANAFEIMRDEEADYSHRLVACAIIMLFRLGIRIDDLMDFRINNLKKDAVKIKGIKISYIDYYITKLSRHKAEAFGHTIFASDDTVEAFETMKEIRITQSGAGNSDHLFILGGKVISKTIFSQNLYPLYMYRFHKDICDTDKYSEVFHGNSTAIKGKTLYYPETRQYRVWLCSDLYAKGVSWNYIEEHLKHLSTTMANYYNRPEDTTPEYVAYAENILETMLVEKVVPIGVAGKAIRENIEKFLDDNDVNAVKDFNEVMKVLGDKVAIRAKTGGFCFKTSFVPCSQEIGTNKMLCAYNLCPNVYSFYYMLDYTYAQFKAHVEAYEQNYIKGMKNSAQKELVEIKSLILRAFEPQVRQLEEEIRKCGFKAIADRHPNIIDVAANLTEIKKQLSEWKRKTAN